ncbi:MAG: type II secretion system F family protein [Phycisphaerae bacterium]|jgi:type IV pilus assembly protein PilC|nr:type II secretion system F family protein [Phycisphaerae bacterium]HOO15696.1 type II secretion system F family protein [Phycisphaerae bacterium]HPC21930.1 type II secretion system F family protein [Phycisphaerae bacterium]HRS28194.1 type II secretion system F family protein [Phycisphaerae bacterium]HRT42637.1 type II secretion system F family protein [Phycisphaerae bacterium]
MAVFQYEALNASGQEIRDSLEAPTKEDAVAKVRGLGYFPTKVVEKTDKKRIVARQVSGTRKRKAAGTGFGRVPVKQLTAFTRQLSTLQDAGLPILRSLRILEQQQKPSMLRRVLKEVHDDVEGGSTLSEALTRHPKAFNRLYCNMVAAGEAGGVLDVILQRLAEFMEKGQRLRRKVIGAMVYPAVVITIAAAIVTFIMVQVVPKFRDIFRDFGATLPAPTEILIATSTWFAKGSKDVPVPGWVVVVVSPLLIFAIFKLIRQAKIGRYVIDTSLMSLPVAGQIASKSSIARFTRTLGTLIAAGVPILEAINITRDTTGNEVFARMLQKVHDSIREGDTFANPLRASKTVDAIVVNMVDVGEETGELDKMLMKVADNYDEEVDTLVGSLVSLLEPIMVVILGLIVGYIVVALFLPLVQLIQTLQAGS